MTYPVERLSPLFLGLTGRRGAPDGAMGSALSGGASLAQWDAGGVVGSSGCHAFVLSSAMVHAHRALSHLHRVTGNSLRASRRDGWARRNQREARTTERRAAP